MNFLESYCYMDLMLILKQIPHLLHLEGKLFESYGCLLLVCRDDIGSSKLVNLVHCLEHCFGRKGRGFFLVINLYGKVVEYNLISKTLREIYDCGSNQIDDNHDDDDDELCRWVNKCVNKFNPYARYGVKHWKNPHAKIFYIRKQKELGKPKEEIYSNSKMVQVIKTYWELGHEHKFITEIPDYKNLNKNDIEDIYLLIMNGKVPDYADTGLLWSLSKVNLTAPTMTFPGIEDHEMFSIIYEHVHGIIYKNNKKEKQVMRHSEIHKFGDAMLNRVIEGLKSYNNDVKYGYVQKDLTKDETEYLKLFEEEISIEGR
ncbi:hypothetical protein Tco_0565439 [Tanacetum coccineum]